MSVVCLLVFLVLCVSMHTLTHLLHYSAYNLFFQLEREVIMSYINSGKDPKEDELDIAAEKFRREEERRKGIAAPVAKEDGANEATNDEEKKPAAATKPKPPVQFDPKLHEPPDPTAPPRYRNLRLEKYWFRAGMKAKRRHRKTDGNVGFIELTKIISKRWASIEKTNPEVKKYCQKIADQVSVSTWCLHNFSFIVSHFFVHVVFSGTGLLQGPDGGIQETSRCCY